jgi:hypothetical protein
MYASRIRPSDLYRFRINFCENESCRTFWLDCSQGFYLYRKCGRTPMPRGGFELTIAVPELFKTIRLSLCFNSAPRHKSILGEWRYISTHSSASAFDGGEWSGSLSGRFTQRERAPGTHCVRGWVGPRAVLYPLLLFSSVHVM